MPTIHVELFTGRTIAQKRALARALTEATVQTLGGSAAGIDVIFTEVQRHDWATGGTLWSDVAPPAAAGTARAAAAVKAPVAPKRARAPSGTKR